jgi:hypothetical protein
MGVGHFREYIALAFNKIFLRLLRASQVRQVPSGLRSGFPQVIHDQSGRAMAVPLDASGRGGLTIGAGMGVPPISGAGGVFIVSLRKFNVKLSNLRGSNPASSQPLR